MNTICITGRLIREPEIKEKFGKITLAHDLGWGDNKTTMFLNCVVYGKTKDFVNNYVQKGDLVGVTGRLEARQHEGKTYYSVQVSTLDRLSFKKKDESAPEPVKSKPQPESEDEFPF